MGGGGYCYEMTITHRHPQPLFSDTVSSCNGQQALTKMLMLPFILSYPIQNGTRRAGREKKDNNRQVTDRCPS